jgi:hypothetical protein
MEFFSAYGIALREGVRAGGLRPYRHRYEKQNWSKGYVGWLHVNAFGEMPRVRSGLADSTRHARIIL